jgi:hypothetical protein
MALVATPVKLRSPRSAIQRESRAPVIMRPRLRKLALTAHVVSSVGWLGAVAGFLALAVVGVSSDDVQQVRAVYVAMDVIAWFVIVPLAFASLLTGLVQSLGTPWGLIRHYWVVLKLVLTVVATIVLLLQMEGISFIADVARDTTMSSGEHRGTRTSLLLHAGGGLLVLLMTTVLAIYKPPGLTRYGRRKQARAA